LLHVVDTEDNQRKGAAGVHRSRQVPGREAVRKQSFPERWAACIAFRFRHISSLIYYEEDSIGRSRTALETLISL